MDLASLEPFPCALDGSCPESLACVPGYGCTRDVLSKAPFACTQAGMCPAGLVCVDAQCTRPVADTICDDGSSSRIDCSLAGPGYQCVNDLCAAPCNASASGCGPGKVCIDSYCRTDCSTSGTCPAGLSCKPTYFSGGGTGAGDGGRTESEPSKLCLAPGYAFSPCASVASASSCAAPTPLQCPGAELTCGSSSTGSWTCPLHAKCSATFGRCQLCDSGYTAVFCDGTPCEDSCEGNWACRKNSGSATEPESCTASLAGWSGVCRCKFDIDVPFPCTTEDTLEDDSSSCEKICQRAVEARR